MIIEAEESIRPRGVDVEVLNRTAKPLQSPQLFEHGYTTENLLKPGSRLVSDVGES